MNNIISNKYLLTAAFLFFGLVPVWASTNTLLIKIASATYSDEIAVRFMPGATTGFDGCCDSWKLFAGNNAVPQVFTKTDIGDELAINSLPSLTSNNLVDLFVRIGVAATYTITTTLADPFAPLTILTLIDNATGSTYDLTSTTPHIISLPAIALGSAARFSVQFIPPPTILPVDLTYFTASVESNKVLVRWATASEFNNHHFSLEKGVSYNEVNVADVYFEQISSMPSIGNSSVETSYEFLDRSEIIRTWNKTIYYRLKQVDHNGQEKYYGPISASYSKDNLLDVIVYPTISTGTFFITGNLENASVSICNLAGQKTPISFIEDNNGSGTYKVDVNNYISGIYFLHISYQYREQVQKIIIN